MSYRLSMLKYAHRKKNKKQQHKKTKTKQNKQINKKMLVGNWQYQIEHFH